ncbi:class I SAM-dependent methyltransferase [Cohnella abietis]|uniref:Methyltransferase type 11 domain-containing protein n=1 Tax=Cohnella abietis TaxID=2507935 RepID=A0A3T1DDB4_9BACL|nr:hypothetical protein [Cohnella abietis]BBI36079.1 hypothetical protein KCTCHS21_54780 [Cohnella abietis]
MGIAGLELFNYFLFDRKPLPYNQLPYGNCSERTIEIPIAIQFLLEAGAGKQEPFLEIGNVLAYYQALLDPHPSLANRHILDKFEEAPGVMNIDLMDYEKKHSLIVCLSTVEHIGQHAYGESKSGDGEIPLTAIRQIYNLLEPGGTALLTVPYGKLMDAGWLIQFSAEYLDLLFDAYGVPRDAASISYFQKQDMDMHLDVPRQAWIQCEKEALAETRFDSPFMFANGIAIIRLQKIGNDIPTATIPLTQTKNLHYTPAAAVTNLYFTPFIRPTGFDKDGRLPAHFPGYIFYGPSISLAPRRYLIQASVEIIGQGEFTIDITSDSCNKLLWSQTLSGSQYVEATLILTQEENNVDIRFYKHNTSECYIKVPSLLLTEEKNHS